MSFPNFTFWSHLLATVGVEVCCLAALGLVAQRFFRPAVWQRAVWQMTVVCLLLLPVSEWTGFGRGAAGFLFGRERVVEKARASGVAAFKSGVAGGPAAVKWNRPPAARPAVWWPGWVWLAGTVIVLGRMTAAQVLLLALRLRRERLVDGSLRERVAHVANCVGLRRKVYLMRMPQAISPMAFGILRPCIGLPPEFEARFSAREQEAVLAHELAHLAAMDPMWFLLADVASALLWWHPLAWWVRSSLHGAAELAADEAAALVPDGPGELAKCLVILGKEMTAARGWGWVGINGGFRSRLGKRVERLMRMPGGTGRPLAGWAGAAGKIAATILIVPAIVLLFGAFQSARGQKEDSWRGEMRESWNNSPGALLLLAALDDKGTQTENVLTRVQEGKLLYEMGKLDESEKILVQVLKEDPSNKAARYYLDLIKEARFSARTYGVLPISNAMAATNQVYATGRQEILAKLNRIHLDEVSFDLPLSEAVNLLRAESKKRDPDGVGVNFMINPRAVANVGAPPAIELSQVRIKISPPVRNVRMVDVLNMMTTSADPPIWYSVDDYAVVFWPKPPQSLYTKVFKVDPNTFAQGLAGVSAINLRPSTTSTGGGGSGGSSSGSGVTIPSVQVAPGGSRTGLGLSTNSLEQVNETVKKFFAASGVDLTDPGKVVFFNDRLGKLLVRASLQDFEIIEQAVELLNQAPPQLLITAQFVELSQEDVRAIGLNWYVGSNTFMKTPTMPNNAGIMTEPQYRTAINAIKQRTGTELLAAPKVTTLSGRQTHIVTTDGGNGVALDVIAVIGLDGVSIQTTVIPSIITGGKVTSQMVASHKLWDGQTLLIGGVMTNQPPGAGTVRMVFVTLRIIDAEGNPVHSDAELSKRPGIPVQ